MVLLAQQLSFMFVMVMLVMVPGAALAWLLRVRSSMPVSMLPAAWTVLGLGWATIVTALVVVGPLPRYAYLGLLALPVVACVVAVATSTWRGHLGGRGENVELSRSLLPMRAGAWMVAWACIVGVMTGLRGATFRGDGAFHAALVEKLVALPRLTPGTLSLFSDHEPMSSVLVPAWHQLLAGAAVVLQVENPGLLAVWSASGAASVLLVSAALATGGVATGSDSGAAATAVIVPVVLLASWWSEPVVLQETLGYPGNVTLFVVLPALFAFVVHLAVTTSGSYPSPARGGRVGVLVVIAAATIVVGALHVTYLYYVAMVGVALVVATLLLDRDAARRLVGPAVVVAATSLLVVAAQIPTLMDHREFARGSGGDAAQLVRATWVDQMDGASFAVEPSWAWMMGLPFVAGLVLVPLVVFARRARLAAILLVLVPTLVLAAASRVAPIGELVAGLGSYTPIPRTHRMFAAGAALVVVAIAAGDHLRGRRAARVEVVVAGIAAAALAVATVVTAPSRMGRDHSFVEEALLPGWTFDATIAAMVASLSWVVVSRRVRARRASDGHAAEDIDAASGATASLTAASLGFLTVFAVVGMTTWVWHAAPQASKRPYKLVTARGLEVSPLVHGPGAELVRRLVPGSTVLVDPELSIRMAALAPVYITTTDKQLLSSPSRERDARWFVSEPPEVGPPGARRGYIARHGVDAIFVPAPDVMAENIDAFVREHLGWQRIDGRDGVAVYCRDACSHLRD